MPVEAVNLQQDHAPLGGEWQIDPTHSSVGFVAWHMMVAKVRGRFASFQGELHIDARRVHTAVQRLTFPHNHAGGQGSGVL